MGELTKQLLGRCRNAGTRAACEEYIQKQCIPQYEAFTVKDPEGKGEYVLRPAGSDPYPAGSNVRTCARMANRVAQSVGGPATEGAADAAPKSDDPCAGSRKAENCRGFAEQCRQQ